MRTHPHETPSDPNARWRPLSNPVAAVAALSRGDDDVKKAKRRLRRRVRTVDGDRRKELEKE